MKNTFGTNISLTLFGESHGASVGFVLDGLPAGIKIDMDELLFKIENKKENKGYWF